MQFLQLYVALCALTGSGRSWPLAGRLRYSRAVGTAAGSPPPCSFVVTRTSPHLAQVRGDLWDMGLLFPRCPCSMPAAAIAPWPEGFSGSAMCQRCPLCHPSGDSCLLHSLTQTLPCRRLRRPRIHCAALSTEGRSPNLQQRHPEAGRPTCPGRDTQGTRWLLPCTPAFRMGHTGLGDWASPARLPSPEIPAGCSVTCL